MSSEVEQLHLEATDTIVTVRERLARRRGQRVLVIWQPDHKNLRRKLDLVLIQREAYRRAIQLAIVTEDLDQHYYAAGLNISGFDSIEASDNERWKRGRQKVFLPRYHKPNADLKPEDLEFIASRIAGRGRRSPWRTVLERVVVLLILLCVTGMFGYVVLPGASVVVNLRVEQIGAVVDITADRKAQAVDLNRGIIPAHTIRETVETTATIPTSGSARLDSISAAGVAIFTNLSAAQVEIPQSTVLGTSAGEPIFFETSADVVVPAGVGQSVSATVLAMVRYRGTVGNVAAGMINTVFGALADQVSVINLAPSAGGVSPSVMVVTAEDRNTLRERVRVQLQSLAFETMRSGLGDSQIIIIESIQIEEERKDWTMYSADVGTMTSELSLTMRASVSALVVDERFARQVALSRLKAVVPEHTEMIADSVVFKRGPFSWDPSSSWLTFAVTGSASVITSVDRDELRRRLAGISVDRALEILNSHEALSQLDRPQLAVFPAALQQMPTLPLRIDLQVQERGR